MDRVQGIARLSGTLPSGRAIRHFAGFLILLVATGQLLVTAHAAAHPSSRPNAACSACVMGSHLANVPDVPPFVSRQQPVALVLGRISPAPYVQPARRTRLSRAPPHA